MSTPTAEQLDTLRHMLGINQAERCRPYRDHFAANPGDKHLGEMERLGLVELRDFRPTEAMPYELYVTTARGRALALESQIACGRAVRPSRARQRYIDFLNLRDVMPDLTFREFLSRRATFAESTRHTEGS